MVKRRTLGEGLTPEEEAFMNPSGAPAKAAPAEAEEQVMAAVPEPAAEMEPVRPAPHQPSVVFTLQTPLPGMVGLTTRIPAGISAALMAAAMQRRIQRLTPCTHQDIVSEAITEWLKKNGFGVGGAMEPPTDLRG